MKLSPSKEIYNKNAHIFKILAHAKRLEILNLLIIKELKVEEIRKATKIPKANLSQHLALLRHNGLLKARREGLNIFYKIGDRGIIELYRVLNKLRDRHIIV